MSKDYIYNLDTGKLHIKGYCQYSKHPPVNSKFFETENDALAFDGRAVGMCKFCEKERTKKEKRK